MISNWSDTGIISSGHIPTKLHGFWGLNFVVLHCLDFPKPCALWEVWAELCIEMGFSYHKDRNDSGKFFIPAIASSETIFMNFSSLLLPILDEDLLVQVKGK